MAEPLLPVAFEWRKPHKRDGFVLVEQVMEGATGPEPVLRNHGRHSFDSYEPLTDETGLFRTFADTDPTPAGCLRFANRYGLFAVMTRARYEIEFQGTADGKTWIAYPFRYKPQDVRKAPGIYAPYQPRFEWNLWFASLGTWLDNRWVLNTEVRLLQNQPAVLQLFAGNPFAGKPPVAVRAMQWQYWFTSVEERRKTGAWLRRELVGQYAPTARRMPDGTIEIETESSP